MTDSIYKKAMICIFIVIALLLSTMTVFADTAGITIKLKTHENLGSPAGVNFSFYKIGEIDESTGAPVFDQKYNITKKPKAAADIRDIIQQLKNTDKGSPVKTSVTSTEGILSVSLDTGIYYIEAEANAYGNIEPSLVWLPYYTIDGSGQSYNVELIPKAEPEGEVMPEEKYPEDERVLDEEAKVRGEEAKTGDFRDYAGYIGIALLSILMVFLIVRRELDGKEKKDVI